MSDQVFNYSASQIQWRLFFQVDPTIQLGSRNFMHFHLLKDTEHGHRIAGMDGAMAMFKIARNQVTARRRRRRRRRLKLSFVTHSGVQITNFDYSDNSR